MTFVDQWRAQLPNSLAIYRKAIRAAGKIIAGLDPKYGVIAAGVLWPVRQAGKDDLGKALCDICGATNDAQQLVGVIYNWSDPITAARELSAETSENLSLISALEKLLAYFQDELLKAEFVTLNVRYSHDQSSLVNIDHNLFFYGDIVRHIVQDGTLRYPAPPTEPVQFVERGQVMEELIDKLRHEEPTTIIGLYGVSGIGKTTLASKLANILYRDKTFCTVLWANVTRNPDPLITLHLWGSYGRFDYSLADLQPEQIALQVKKRLTNIVQDMCKNGYSKRVLAVFDDVWDDSEGMGKAAVKLLQLAVPENTTILITTSSLELAKDLTTVKISLDRMTENESIQMVQRDQAFYAFDREKLKTFADVLAGHPLALELAVQRFKNNDDADPSTILHFHTTLYRKDIESRVGQIESNRQEGNDNYVNAVISKSYTDLTSEEQTRFRMLGILPQDVPFDRTILSSLWNVPVEQVDSYCGPLQKLSLLKTDPNNGTDRYRQHALLRHFALKLLQQMEETESVFLRYADKVVELAQCFNTIPLQYWHKLTLYVPHINFVGDKLVEQFDPVNMTDEQMSLAHRFVCNISAFLTNHQEARYLEWLKMGLVTSHRAGDLKAEAYCLNNIGDLWYALGNQQEALGFYERALPLYQATGNRNDAANILNNIGKAYYVLGKKRKALDYFKHALALRRETGDIEGEAIVLNNIGMVWSNLGERRAAIKFYEHALALYQITRNRRGEATSLNNIGSAWSGLKKKRKARGYFNRALSLTRAIQDIGGEGTILNNLGSVWSDLGRKRKALGFYEQALPLRRMIGNQSGEAATLNNIGAIWLVLGNNHKALEYYEQSLSLSKASLDRSGEAITRLNIGRIYYMGGELEKAIEYTSECVRLGEEVELPDLEHNRLILKRLKDERSKS